MKKLGEEIYYGKIILFGEYGIIFDSMALTIPFTHYHGGLSFDNKSNKFKYTDYDFANDSNILMKEFAQYLHEQTSSGKLKTVFDIKEFDKDLENGLYFESSIPQGFGLGSSGALVAALYYQYAHKRINGGRSVNRQDTLKLKDIFSTMESFFHGRSSGIDPLNSYIKFPLLIKSKNEIETVGIPRNKFDNNSAIFLINTGKPGKTEPLVNLFLENCKRPDYFDVVNKEFIPLNNACIGNLINGEMEEFFANLSKLSDLQFNYFNDMIPADYYHIWKDGLASDTFKLKLCGSGGGGYLLGFTNEYCSTRKYLKEKNLDFITVYKSNK